MKRGVVLTLLAFALLLAFASPAFAFSDVSSNHPYYEAIEELSGRNIIEGYGDGRFGPGDLVTRQQFAKMIVLILGVPVSEEDVCPFVDVDVSGPGGFYPDNYVAVAAKHRITKGVDHFHFAAWQKISRAQVITMVVRAVDSLHPGLLTPAGSPPTWGWFRRHPRAPGGEGAGQWAARGSSPGQP